MALLNPAISSYTGMSVLEDGIASDKIIDMKRFRHSKKARMSTASAFGPWELLQQQLMRDAQLAGRKPVDEVSGIRNILSALGGNENYLVD